MECGLAAGVTALLLFPIMKKEYFENLLGPNTLLSKLAGIWLLDHCMLVEKLRFLLITCFSLLTLKTEGGSSEIMR